jgi:sugar lactone lactonase YvrE
MQNLKIALSLMVRATIVLSAAVLVSACGNRATATGTATRDRSSSANSATARLFKARDYVGDDVFTRFIEGPAVGPDGALYLVGLGSDQNIARVVPKPDGTGKVSLFVKLPKGSTASGIRFKDDTMYVTDYSGHKVLRVNMNTRKVGVFARLPGANQPNDLALAPDGTFYASDPDWKNGTGQLWRIDADGNATRLETGMGTTNGIAVSPDGKRLYVDETKQRKVWVYDINADDSLANKRLFIQFPDHGMDGMRCDADGNVYIARYGAGKVVVVSPAGKILHKIMLQGPKPTNVAFGGPDGRQVFVTMQSRGAIETFQTDVPGRFQAAQREK